MSDKTGIEWTGRTWLLWPGCDPKSAGCLHCYALLDGWRLSYNPNHAIASAYAGIVKKVLADGTEIIGGQDHPRRREAGVLKFTGLVRFLPHVLAKALRWRDPGLVFVSANSDLFLPARTDNNVDLTNLAATIGVMAAAKDQTFQVLTKWPERIPDVLAWIDRQADGCATDPAEWCMHAAADVLYAKTDDVDLADRLMNMATYASAGEYGFEFDPDEQTHAQHTRQLDRIAVMTDGLNLEVWPPKNIWFGASVENRAAKRRIDDLRKVDAAVRFLSCEPLIEDLGQLDLTGISWVIVGGESGKGSRRCDVAWIRSIVEQCREQGVKVFVKQLGANPDGLGLVKLRSRKGGDLEDLPEDLRLREFPRE